MRYISVCSGIEAASCAWHPLGWRPVAFSEIGAFPSAVLAERWPEVPNLGDMTQFHHWPNYESVDLLVGGTPCQSFSIAGLRKGLADPRGNLALTYLAIAARYRPRWILWENVPGVLSSVSHDAPDPSPPPPPMDVEQDGAEVETEDEYGAEELHALNCFLAGLSELGYGWSFRVLDAQYAGVPQRRRRVFVVGHLGDWRRAAAVLFERHSLQGHNPPSRQTRERIAPTISARTRGGGGLGTDFDCDGGLIAHTLLGKANCSHDTTLETYVAHSLRGEGFDASEDGTGRGTPLVPVAIQAGALRENPESGPDGVGVRTDGVAYTLEARAEVQAVCFDTTQITSKANRCNPKGGDPCHPLAAGAHAPAIAFDSRMRGAEPAVGREERPPQTDDRAHGSDRFHLAAGSAVRRLTATECARLQGFPDDYLELLYANAEEAHAAQVLHILWRKAGEKATQEQGWGTGITASLLTPQVLLAGVHGGWLSWEMAHRSARASREVSGANGYTENMLRSLRINEELGRSPFRRESFEQCAIELACPLQALPLERAQARAHLRSSELWKEAQAAWPLRYAFSEKKAGRPDKLNPDGPRYKALGNSMAVNVMSFIGRRIAMVNAL